MSDFNIGPELSLLVIATILAAAFCSGLLIRRVIWRGRFAWPAIGTVIFATAAYAASSTLGNLTTGGAVSATDLFYDVQTVGTGGVKVTASQLLTYIAAHVGTVTSVTCNGVAITTSGTCGALTGDITSSAGAAATTLKNTGPGATGPIGSTTAAPSVTIDAQGRVTALTNNNIAFPVTSVATGCQASGGTTGAVTISTQLIESANSPAAGGGYTLASSDLCTNLVLKSGYSGTLTIPVHTTSGFAQGVYGSVTNESGAAVTVAVTTDTIGGLSTFTLLPAWSFGYHIGTDNEYHFAFGGNTVGIITSQSGTTYTLAASDCSTQINFTNASAVTVTIPSTLPVGCNVALLQAGAGKVSVNGSAVTPATLHSAHSYTGTSAQWAMIGVNMEASTVAILTGDGS